jgi:hypothetical protein
MGIVGGEVARFGGARQPGCGGEGVVGVVGAGVEVLVEVTVVVVVGVRTLGRCSGGGRRIISGRGRGSGSGSGSGSDGGAGQRHVPVGWERWKLPSKAF